MTAAQGFGVISKPVESVSSFPTILNCHEFLVVGHHCKVAIVVLFLLLTSINSHTPQTLNPKAPCPENPKR